MRHVSKGFGPAESGVRPFVTVADSGCFVMLAFGELGDSMIQGAARCKQLKEALTELGKGPLEPSV